MNFFAMGGNNAAGAPYGHMNLNGEHLMVPSILPAATSTNLLTACFCALQEGDFNGALPGAILQRLRVLVLNAEEAEWLANLEHAWATQCGYQRKGR